MNEKVVSPTGSYQLRLPDDVVEDIDERIASYWRPNSEVLLQFSSFVREEGEQVSATDRLIERFGVENLSGKRNEAISIPNCPDCGAASGIDDEGYCWVFCYAVWPDLTILGTISGPKNSFERDTKWAFDALRSLER